MKTKLFNLIILSLFAVITAKGQIKVETKTIEVPCCLNSDSIDYNNDNKYDIRIYSKGLIDSYGFYIDGLGNTKVAGLYDSGQEFKKYSSYTSLTGTTMGCYNWYSYFVPGAGTIKYVGFRDLSTPKDTIYGWLKIEFQGQQNTCNVKMITSTVAYSQKPNLRLSAGQTQLTGIENDSFKSSDLFELTKNGDNYVIVNKSHTTLSVKIYNLSGQEILNINELPSEKSQLLSILNSHKGLIFINCNTNNTSQQQKIIIE